MAAGPSAGAELFLLRRAACTSIICPSRYAVSRHQSEQGRPTLLSRSRYPSAGIGRETERGVRQDALQSGAGSQIQKRLVPGAEFGPFREYALGSQIFQSVSLPQLERLVATSTKATLRIE